MKVSSLKQKGASGRMANHDQHAGRTTPGASSNGEYTQRHL